jgi:hypothetical protein
MEIRYEYFKKLKHMLKRNRRLGFENIYDSETPISEMKLSTLKHGILEDISSKHDTVTCISTDDEMKMVAFGTIKGELVISSTSNSDFYREDISREKGGRGKKMRKLPNGDIDFITSMKFWSDPLQIYDFNESFGLQEKEVYKHYHKGLDLEEEDMEVSSKEGSTSTPIMRKSKAFDINKKGTLPTIVPEYRKGYGGQGILLLGFKSGRIESLRFDASTFQFVRYCILKKPNGNRSTD